MGYQTRPIPPHRRVAIESEVETHLERVTVLIARLDRADGDCDVEDDDPGGTDLDRGEQEDSYEGTFADSSAYREHRDRIRRTRCNRRVVGNTRYGQWTEYTLKVGSEHGGKIFIP